MACSMVRLLIPPLALIVPWLWWGWLTARLMRFDSLVEHATAEERERLIREYHNTNYSVVDLDLIERIYAILYRQKVSGSERHAFLCRRMIESAIDVDGRVQLQLRDLATGSSEATVVHLTLLVSFQMV